MKRRERISSVVENIYLYGSVDGEHHKAWLIDQTVQILLGAKGYKAFVKEYEEDSDEWDVGIPP